jgi:hypothetical protein
MTTDKALDKSILDFPASATEKAWFFGRSQNQWRAAIDFGSASLHCGNRRLGQRFPDSSG